MNLRQNKHQTMPEQRAGIITTLRNGTLFYELFTHDIMAQSYLLRAIIKELQKKKKKKNAKFKRNDCRVYTTSFKVLLLPS